MNPSENRRLWVIVMCLCRFIYCNKCTILLRNFYNGGGCACVRTGGKGKLSALFFLLKFAVKLKLLEEMKLINYKEIGSNNAYLPI